MSGLVGAPLGTVGDLNAIDDAARNPLGTVAFDAAGNGYIYLQGIGSVAAGDFVVYNSAFLCARALNTPLAGPVAVAVAAVVASKFGWFQIDGLTPATTNVATASSAGLPLFMTSSAGRASITPAAGCAILGAWAVGTSSSNETTVMLHRPFAPGFTLASA